MDGHRLVTRLCGPCLAFLILTGAFDLTCTLVANGGGWLLEQNPIAATVLDSWGAIGLVVFKVAVTVTACLTLWLAVRLGCRKQPGVILVGIFVAAGAYAWLTAHWIRCLAEFL